MSSQRAWKFTVFGENMALMPDLLEITAIKDIVFQHEICPTTYNEHLQGFLVLRQATTMRRVQEIIGCGSVHCEAVPKNQWLTQWDYCLKEEGWDRFTYGSRPSQPQGSRSDLQTIGDLIRGGTPVAQIIVDNPGFDSDFIRYNKGLYALETVLAKPLLQRKVIVIEGPPGYGKSAFAQYLYPSNLRVKKGNNGVWYNQYAGQAAVIVEDFYGWMPWDGLLDLTDRYPTTVETKGASRVLVASTEAIIFTCNSGPESWYKYSDRIVYGAFERRITDWYVFTDIGEYWRKKVQCFGPENEFSFREVGGPPAFVRGFNP